MQTEQTIIEGRVAGLLSATELVINIGTNTGVTKGMLFSVREPNPKKFKDPETGEILGIIDREKIQVKVSEVQEKMSICKTTVRQIGGGTGLGSILNVTSSISKILFSEPVYKQDKLTASDAKHPPPLSEKDSYVKINDRVIQIIVAEDEEQDD